tara:strand:+ start:1325 stop:1933 length:609 start_codon:yes stop_codon:yes gene_type:complete
MALTKVTSGLTDLDGGITIDNITIDGTEIDLSSGDLTLDVAGVIKLDADGAEIQIKDGGTEIGAINMASSNLNIDAKVADKDIVFRGIDGSSDVTALTLDMSEAGAATFNSTVTVGDTVFDAVGTYCFANSAGSIADRDGGATLAGSNIKPASSYTDYSGATGYSNETLSGTWRLMGATGEYNNGTVSVNIAQMTTLWVRIS